MCIKLEINQGYLSLSALHVSGDVFAHHKEHLTVFTVILVDLQLDAKILVYLHIIHSLKSSTFFEHYPAHLQEIYVVIVYMQRLVCNAKQARQIYQYEKIKIKLYRNTAAIWYNTIPEAAYIQLWRRPPEDEQGNARNM